MKYFFLSFALFLTSYLATGQAKKLTMEEAMLQARTTLAPENLKQLQFVKGTGKYVYLKKISGVETWVTGDFNSVQESTWINLPDLNKVLRKNSIDTVSTMPTMQFTENEIFVFIKGQKISISTSDENASIVIGKNLAAKENLDESASGNFAYMENDNLYVTDGRETTKVTDDGSQNIVYASTVHQSEFGITKGTFWSNNGKLLAFYRMDQSMVPDYPIVDWTERPAKVNNVKYPMAGDASHHVTLHVYNTATKKTIQINTTGPQEQYLTNIAWSPDDQFVYIVIVNREQNHFWLNQYDATTGAFVKTLFEETDDKYAEPLVPMLFVKNNPKQFIWQSKRSGWNHLYLYNSDGTLVKPLTQGEWEVLEVKGFDDKGERLFFVSTQVSPVSKNLYALQLKTNKIKSITGTDEVHSTQMSNSGEYVLDVFSSSDNPRTIQLIETKSGKSKSMLKAKNPLSDYERGSMSIFTIKNNEGTDLYCRLFKPVNFDSTKKYPVVVYWYGGPHAQMILNGWNGGAGDYWFQYMAERGYVVFTVDTRGSSNRGKVFEQSIFRKAGEKQMEDLMSGIRYLDALPYVDKNNMGLFGWSYGGFLTTNFMLTYPDIFKAAVAGGPVINWKYYEIMYTERYMDRPQENPEGFEATDLTKKIGNLKGKLMLIHGMQDNVVVMQHSVQLVRAAISKGIQLDYMIYPGHEHNVLGKDRAHLYQKVTDYFMQHLK